MDDQKLNFKNNITMGKQIKTLKFKKTRRSWIIDIGKIEQNTMATESSDLFENYRKV